MSDYEQLVKALRERARREDEYYEHGGDVINDAAAAIEALEHELNVQKNMLENLLMSSKESLLPKRGKWIVDKMFTYDLRNGDKAYEPMYRCSFCNRGMESYVRLDKPKMPEDADFPEYCPHCGAKMEVQDG